MDSLQLKRAIAVAVADEAYQEVIVIRSLYYSSLSPSPLLLVMNAVNATERPNRTGPDKIQVGISLMSGLWLVFLLGHCLHRYRLLCLTCVLL